MRPRRPMTWVGIAALLCAAAAGLHAAAADLSVTRVDASRFLELREVCVFATITDADGQSIQGLTRGDFTLREWIDDFAVDGCDITQFDVSAIPGGAGINVALIMDTSGSMGEYEGNRLRIDWAKDAATDFVNLMDVNDRVAIITFSGRSARVRQNFTSNQDDLRSSISGISAGGGTPMFDGACLGISRLREEVGVKAAILFTDGKENDSSGPCRGANNYDPLGVCRHANDPDTIPIYTLGIGVTTRPEDTLKAIAACTGATYQPIFASDLGEIYRKIKEMVLLQYRVCFRNECHPDLDGTTRTVELCLTGAPATPGNPVCDTGKYKVCSPPVIRRTHETIEMDSNSQTAGNPLDICVVVTDDASVAWVKLFYRQVTPGAVFQEMTIPNPSETPQCFTIPAGRTVPPGIEYYITAYDGECSSSHPSVDPTLNPHQIAIMPNEKPVIKEVLSTCPVANVRVTDSTDNVDSVALFYRTPGLVVYTKLPLMLVQGSNTDGIWRGTIPSGDITGGDIEGYLRARDNFGVYSDWTFGRPETPEILICGKHFVRGDVNSDGLVNVADAVYLIKYLFLGGPAPSCEKTADVNDNSTLEHDWAGCRDMPECLRARIDVSDVVYLLCYCFLEGPLLPPPFPACGNDGTLDALTCESYAPCE